MKTYSMREWRYMSTIFDIGTRLMWSASRSGRFILKEGTPGTHWIGGWVGPRDGVDALEYRKSLSPTENRTPALQLIARRYTDWTIPGPLRIDKGNRITRENLTPVPLCAKQIPYDLTWDQTRTAALGTWWLSYGTPSWLLSNPKVHYRLHRNRRRTLYWLKLIISTASRYISKIQFNIILTYTPGSPMWPTPLRVCDQNFTFIHHICSAK
jgi:hypothetical protein